MEILILKDKNEIEEYWTLVKQLGDLYDECFEDGDEKEKFYSVILPRVKVYGGFRPRTELHIAHEDGLVLGGAIYDSYLDTEILPEPVNGKYKTANRTTVHLIYLMVRKDRRREKVGTRLLDFGKERFSGLPIFIEIDREWWDNKPGHGGVTAEERTNFYKKNGLYVVIDKGYLQPPLEKGLRWCEDLMLCTINGKPRRPEVQRFLGDLYGGLGVLGTEEGDMNLKRVLWCLNKYQQQLS